MAKDCDCGCGSRGWIPNGSTVTVNNDLSLTVVPPTGFIYVGFDVLDQLLVVDSGNALSVSCTCNNTTSGGCSPFIGVGPDGSTQGCAGSCTDCTMKQSVALTNAEFKNGGFISLAEKVRFVNDNEKLPAAFDAMFELETVQLAFVAFMRSVYKGLPVPKLIEGDNFATAPDGYSLATISLFNRAAIVAVPTIALGDTPAASSVTCSCTAGTCEKKDYTLMGYGAVYCDAASCTGTCTLKKGTFLLNGGFNSNAEYPSYTF